LIIFKPSRGRNEIRVKQYSAERKAAVVSKLLPPLNRSVSEVSQEEGLAVGTLYQWRDKARLKGNIVPGNKQTTDTWPAEARLATVIEAASLSATELNRYCREKGLYVEQVVAWRTACIEGQRSAHAYSAEAGRSFHVMPVAQFIACRSVSEEGQ